MTEREKKSNTYARARGHRLFALMLMLAACGGPKTPAKHATVEQPPDCSKHSAQSRRGLQQLLCYIHGSWDRLTRTNKDLLKAAVDPKLHGQHGPWTVYFPRDTDIPKLTGQLKSILSERELASLRFSALPDAHDNVRPPGLLYLPHPYVVPGGRFNEMFGWDSYFIVLGLLRDGRSELARQMTDNQLYEVEHYGAVLNANRTYFLTRSQPPFLARMVLSVYAHTRDAAWLRRALPLLERYHRFWVSAPHITNTGLSRYYDVGRGPAADVESEHDEFGRSHYERVAEYYRTHDVTDYDEARFFDPKSNRLTDLFYVADRSMRESGFDPSNRFGQFGVGVIDENPVCLNSLLYVMERDLEEIHRLLGHPRDAGLWAEKAKARAALVNSLLWDEESGLYFDYDFTQKKRRRYPYATTFYPLWAGIASREQAAKVAANLKLFERAGGLQTSTQATGQQWDAPFGWAPLQLFAVLGLRAYGYEDAATRISTAFLSLVLREFERRGGIFEKYDVVAMNSESKGKVRFGYLSNEVGFGWTNGVILEFLDLLTPEQTSRIGSTP